MPYYVQRAATERQAYAAQAAALAQQQSLWERAQTAASRLAAADYAYKNGQILVASRLYRQMASSHPPDELSAAAKERLTVLAEDARRKLKEIDVRLYEQKLTPEVVAAAFEEYRQLSRDYDAVAAVRREIRTHVRKQSIRPEYAALLNEPEAAALWEAGRKHEEEDHACCAYWVYQEAARLEPAPSAKKALKRYEEMGQDLQTVAAAEACRQLQECHRLYNRAERVVEINPARARELFSQIIDRAPEDSEVYLAARNQIDELPR